MEHRDYNYYEAHAAGINLEEITSSAKNAKILQQLRDGDANLRCLSLEEAGPFCTIDVSELNDWGWLDEGEEGHALLEGIARSQSIRDIDLHALNNDGFTSIMRALHSLSQLEGLTIWGDNNIGSDCWSELETLLEFESGVRKLKKLYLDGNNYIGNEGVDVLSNGLRGIGTSLTIIHLSNNSIGNEGLLALVGGLTNCSSLKTLDLSCNDFSSAAAGLRSLSDWLQRDEVNLKYLFISHCHINDDGLHVLAQAAVNQCEALSITATGLSYLSNVIRSDSCRVESLYLDDTVIENDGMEVLAVGNQSLTSLHLDDIDNGITVTSAGWLAFSRALCDTSSVNSTYLSNHTIRDIWGEDDEERPITPQDKLAFERLPVNNTFLSNHTIWEFRLGGAYDQDAILPRDISRYLQLHKQHPRYAARCKILMKHPHLHMLPFLDWGLKFLPLAVAWFERAKPCTTLTIEEANFASTSRMRVLEESREAFESRALTAVYEFIRGMPLEVMKSRQGLAVATAYDEKIARIEEENKIRDERYREALEQRDERYDALEEALEEALEQCDSTKLQLEEEIARLKGENERLSGIVKGVRKCVGV
eukprot:scaffold7325_cov80-Skeletonema_marinoi.AAC.9